MSWKSYKNSSRLAVVCGSLQCAEDFTAPVASQDMFRSGERVEVPASLRLLGPIHQGKAWAPTDDECLALSFVTLASPHVQI